MFRTCAALSIACLAGTLAFSQGANAQANCDEYGRLALGQQKENETKKCGFQGPEWSSDLKAHVGWCKGKGPAEWIEQLRLRNTALTGCKAKG